MFFLNLRWRYHTVLQKRNSSLRKCNDLIKRFFIPVEYQIVQGKVILLSYKIIYFTAQKMKISIKDFFSRYDQIITHLLKKSLIENLYFLCIAWSKKISFYLYAFSYSFVLNCFSLLTTSWWLFFFKYNLTVVYHKFSVSGNVSFQKLNLYQWTSINT